MKLPHWLEGCRGPYVAASYSCVQQYKGPQDVQSVLGYHTRPIAKCSTCGKLFATETVPGKWTVDELKGM